MSHHDRINRKKISLIGAGQIGGVMTLLAAQKQLGDIVLLDIPAYEKLAQGKMLDILHAAPVYNADAKITATADWDATRDSDVVIVSAGFPRKPGMSRDDLLLKNCEITKPVAENIKKYCPNAFVIAIQNPLDAMVQLTKVLTGFPKNRVVGQAGILDSVRFRAFIAMELNVSVQDVTAVVLGGHGPTMVPLVRYCNVAGIPVTQLLPKEKIDAIVKRTQDAGTEIVALYGTGSAFFSPAAASIDMAEAIIRDKKRVVCCAAFLEGEYGFKDYYMGVPVILGGGGVEKVIEVEINDEERKALGASFEATKKNIDELKRLNVI
ncbi:malate dehydrogenase [candidate division TA06 bacterium]|uniref:Malate dehydrogenase n=1 Tax=candidate division TA06 bacterium TaxID=2250710 RepID=A0A933I7D3_UNCT6|nr:malate dehydrogenase [candidate division TA06 bacterium]